MTIATQSANEILRQALHIEAILNDPLASKGRVTALKSAHRKLYGAYRRAMVQS